MIQYPNIEPVILSFGILKISWYSVSYVVGILFGWNYSIFLAQKFNLNIKKTQIEDFISWLILSIIIGGRLGYVLFYNLDDYLAHPIEILKTYEGGMSFHGAVIGILIGAILYSRKYKIPLYELSDLICVSAPFGIMLARIANFINGELYGKVTNSKLGMIFPANPDFPRHPSQLYEAFSEGLVLMIIMMIAVFYSNVLKYQYRATGIFLIFYAIFRSICEFFREPDGHILFFTEGQFLSLPMLIVGIIIIKLSLKENNC